MATYSAREPFSFTSVDGMPRSFGPGDLIEDTDVDFPGREQLFQPVEEAAAMAHNRRGAYPGRALETATAAPGEVRHVGHTFPTDTPISVPDALPAKPPVAPNKPTVGAKPAGK